MSENTQHTQHTKRKLPPGWRWVRLGEVCHQDRNMVGPKSETAARLSYLGLEAIESQTGRILKAAIGPAADEGISTTFAFDARHVLYGKLRPYLNKVALPDFAGRCTTEVIPLLPKQELDKTYLCWLLRRTDTVAVAMRDVTGSRMPRADMSAILKHEIPLPPLPEQRRIAAILKEQMAAVDKARSAAEMRLDAVKALPAAFLREVFPKSGEPVPVGWETRSLGSVGQFAAGLTLGRKVPAQTTHEIPYLRVANVKDGHLDLTEVFTTWATDDEIVALTLQAGDLLLTEGGDPDKLGRGALWKNELPTCLHQNHIYRVRIDKTMVDPSFAAYQLGSPYGKAYFLKHAKQTTGIATINQRIAKAFPLLVPSLADQRRLAARLREQMAAAETARAAAEAELAAINALPAALLRRAFNGEL